MLTPFEVVPTVKRQLGLWLEQLTTSPRLLASRQRLAPWFWHKAPCVVSSIERHLPLSWRVAVLQQGLTQLLQVPTATGDLDFLFGKTVRFEISNWQLGYRFCLAEHRYWYVDLEQEADVTIKASSEALLALLCQQADPDMLFFRRQLTVAGDTELGVHLKHALAAMSAQWALPAWLQATLEPLAAQSN